MIWGVFPLFLETSMYSKLQHFRPKSAPPWDGFKSSPLNTPLGHSQWLVCYDCLFEKDRLQISSSEPWSKLASKIMVGTNWVFTKRPSFNRCQVIQATWRWRSPTTLERVTDHHPKKGHDRRIARCLLILNSWSVKFHQVLMIYLLAFLASHTAHGKFLRLFLSLQDGISSQNEFFLLNHDYGRTAKLVGSFKSFEKYARQIGSFPQTFRGKIKHIWNHQLVNLWNDFFHFKVFQFHFFRFFPYTESYNWGIRQVSIFIIHENS